MTNCLLKIKEISDTLSNTEKRICDVILSNPSKFCLMNVTELAQYCSTSPATITRMCKSLGYSGYKDFIKDLMLDVSHYTKSEKSEDDYEEVTRDDSLTSIIHKICTNNILAINNSLQIMDADAIQKAVDWIAHANKVHFYGIGGSSVAAMDAEYKFLRIGIDAKALTSFHEQIFGASSLTKDDVAVLISYSGETEEIIEVAKLCKKVDAKVIAITRYSNNTLSNLADVTLKTTSIGNSIRSVSSGVRIAQSNMIDILYSASSIKDYDKIKKLHELTNEIINKGKTR